MQRSPLLPEVAVDLGLSSYILHTLQPGFLAYRFAFMGRIIGEQGEHTEGSPERVGLGLPAWNLHTLHIPHIHDNYKGSFALHVWKPNHPRSTWCLPLDTLYDYVTEHACPSGTNAGPSLGKIGIVASCIQGFGSSAPDISCKSVAA
ncbi:hypothetical protein VNO77_27342 [Canavalia gladiata]|uniref:Uncharacterized protein n=1 Tax=Canavalia gladiata TaxID=3824 RepID=A0AAN9KVL6_CANGL